MKPISLPKQSAPDPAYLLPWVGTLAVFFMYVLVNVLLFKRVMQLSGDDRPSFTGRTVEDASFQDGLGLIDSESEKQEETPQTMRRVMPEKTRMTSSMVFRHASGRGRNRGRSRPESGAAADRQ
jgi:hypothetical protein